MTEEEKDLEEWLAEERARLDKGFAFGPKPSSGEDRPDAGDEILAGLGIGAGVIGGALGPHPNPVAFEGVKASVIARALESELASDDTRVEIERSDESTVVTFLKSQESRGNAPHRFSPALVATLIEAADMLTITLSDFNQEAKRSTLSSMGGTLVDQGKRALFRGRSSSVAGLLGAAGDLIEGVDDLAEDVQDLRLPRRVWAIIDRVGKAAEEAYLEEKREARKRRRRREEAERAWTHCPSCGRAYREEEANRVDCPSCGAPRGDKPAWLK